MKNALLLVNLGSPESPSITDVRKYLNEFLMDPYVIDLPWIVRRLLVWKILQSRPRNSAQSYRSIWWDEGSPLVVISERLRKSMTEEWKDGPVELAMRYGSLSIEKSLTNIFEKGIRNITVAPLYPQFADSTVTTVTEEIKRIVRYRKLDINFSIVPTFYSHPQYLNSLYNSVEKYLKEDFDHLLFSFHGLPERHIKKSDPTQKYCLKNPECCRNASEIVLGSCYRAQSLYIAESIAGRLFLPSSKWSVSFQSRLGRAKWITPDTEVELKRLAKERCKKIVVICPSFVADCIETLEEIGIRGREVFIAAGGKTLTLVPCLNDRKEWAKSLSEICKETKSIKNLE